MYVVQVTMKKWFNSWTGLMAKKNGTQLKYFTSSNTPVLRVCVCVCKGFSCFTCTLFLGCKVFTD